MEQLIKLMNKVTGADQVVVKTVPAKADWKKRWKELKALAIEGDKISNKVSALKRSFWADVELSMDDYSDMRYNESTEEIEILGDPNKDKTSIKSPFV